MTWSAGERKQVSRFEANLIRILRFFLKRVPSEQALPLICGRFEAPPCLSRTAVALVQDTLARGCVHLLARAGGWRRERHLRSGQPVDGRLWERTPPRELGLGFSRHSLKFLIWITAEDPATKKSRWPAPAEEELTVGDRLLFFYAFESLRGVDHLRALWKRPPFAYHGLCRLAYPEALSWSPAKEAVFAPWTSGPGTFVLETMQRELAQRWLELEWHKANLVDWSAMQALGQAQERVLSTFLASVEAAERPDLARFLFATLARLLADNRTAASWIGNLRGAGPRLADRAATHRAALVLLRQLEPLHRWHRQSQGVGYFDEGYATAQFWQGEWERWQGETLQARARAILQQVEPLSIQGSRS